jgi:hypothetical protein
VCKDKRVRYLAIKYVVVKGNIIMTKFICRRCNMEFISDGHIMKLSQHIIDKHHGKMYLPYEMIKDQFIVEE